jgi:membrane protease YdiL (CAAX protease family)
LLSTKPRNILIEALVLYGIAIGIILVFKFFAFVPFIKENLGGIAGLVFLFLPIEWLYRSGAHPADYGITYQGFGYGLLWAAVVALIVFPPYVLAYKLWFGRPEFHFALPTTFWKGVIASVFLVALPEEVFYRGYVQTRLDAVFRGRVRILGAEVGWSVVITAALFAIGQLVEPRLDRLGTFFPGLVFGWLRARTGTVVSAIVFHALCNLLAQVLYYGYFGVT